MISVDQFLPLSPDEQPLSSADYTKIQNALGTLLRAERKMERARAAGIDCAEKDAQCVFIRDRLEKLKQVYFPNKP